MFLKNTVIFKKKSPVSKVARFWMAVDIQDAEEEVVRACVYGGEKLQFALATRGLKYSARGATRKDYRRVWRAVQAEKDKKDMLAQKKKSMVIIQDYLLACFHVVTNFSVM